MSEPSGLPLQWGALPPEQREWLFELVLYTVLVVAGLAILFIAVLHQERLKREQPNTG